jgi:hypothetical protein
MVDETLDFQRIHTPADHKRAVKVTQVSHRTSGFKMLAYQCSLEEDFDGAPQCYGEPNDPSAAEVKANPAIALQRTVKRRVPGSKLRDDRTALDFLGNATSNPANFKAGNKNFAWAGLYAAPQAYATANGFSIDRRAFLEARLRPRNDKDKDLPPDQKLVALADGEPGWFPAIQGSDAPAPGFYVSGSPVYADRSLRDWNQRKYINAQAIPFAALTPWYRSYSVKLGDFGLAMDPETGAASGFVFGDSGYDDKVGEVSTNLLTALGGDNERDYLFLVFPGSGARIGDAFKFNLAMSVQLGAASAVRDMSRLPDTDSLLTLLCFGGDYDQYKLFRARKLSDAASIAADGVLATIESVLKRYWFDP